LVKENPAKNRACFAKCKQKRTKSETRDFADIPSKYVYATCLSNNGPKGIQIHVT